MPITVTEGGCTIIEGPKAMNLMRLITLRQGLLIEHRTNGRMKLTRGPMCSTRVRRELGLKGNRPKLIEQLDKLIETARSQVTQVREAPAEAPAPGSN